MEGPVYALPPGLRAGPPGQERTIELPVSPYASDYFVHLDEPQSPINLPPPGERGLGVVEGAQAIRFAAPPQTVQNPSRVGPPSGAIEVVIYLAFYCRVTDHVRSFLFVGLLT